MKFIPTVTNNFNFDLSSYDEILLTPSRRTNKILPDFEGSIIIDNGCFSINIFKKSPSRLNDHIEICKEINKDPRCIFILPDIREDLDLTQKYIEKFMFEVNPQKIIIVDMIEGFYQEIEKKLNKTAEFYAIYSPLVTKRKINNPEKYHILGSINEKNEIYRPFRSFDTFIKKGD